MKRAAPRSGRCGKLRKRPRISLQPVAGSSTASAILTTKRPKKGEVKEEDVVMDEEAEESTTIKREKEVEQDDKEEEEEKEKEEKSEEETQQNEDDEEEAQDSVDMEKKEDVIEEKIEDPDISAAGYDDMEDNNDEPRVPKTMTEKLSSKRLIVVLENACLETIKIGKEYQLLNSDDHVSILRKRGRDIAEARPAPSTKQGYYRFTFIQAITCLLKLTHTSEFQEHSKDLQDLWLLYTMNVRATNGPDKLLSVIKNPVTQYFPLNCTSVRAKALVHLDNFVPEVVKPGEPAVFVIGAFARGKVAVEYTNTEIAFSEYPLSAALACAKVTAAFEKYWGVL